MRTTRVVVRATSLRAATGWLEVGGNRYRCALGRSGRRAAKREGDGATPIGRFRLAYWLQRMDRGRASGDVGTMRPIRRADGWCDAPGDRNYNRPVILPYPASTEQLWREDNLYDVVGVLDYNLRPRRRERGSAIFVHLARVDYEPTAGCIALSRRDLRIVMSLIGRNVVVVVPA